MDRYGYLESAFQCITDGVVIVDDQGKFLFFNEAAEKILGLGALEVPPSDWSSVYGRYLPDKVTPYPWERLPLVRAMRGEYVREADMFIRNERIPGAWISVNGSPIRDKTGKLCGGVIIFRDVTASRQSQDVVQRLSKAVERTTDSVFITDAAGEIEYVNPAFETTTGFARQEAVGSRPSILKSGMHGREYYEKLWANILAGNVHSGTLINRKKNGDLFHAEQTITPIKDEAGNITHFVSVLRDVTEIKRAEEREVEMRLARVVQQKLYPVGPPKLAGFDVAGAAFPAEATCGDYFDFIPMSEDCVGLAIGDVAGHGFGSALLMAETRAYLRCLAKTTSDVGEMMRQLNTFLCQDTDDDRFVTLMLARLDPKRRSFLYSSAGHIPGYLLDGSGAVKRVLDSTSIPLGILPGAEFKSSSDIALAEGDMMLLLTDGVTESQNHEEDFFGDERALRVVAAQRQQDAHQIINSLYMAIKGFASRSSQGDDVTAVICKVIAAS